MWARSCSSERESVVVYIAMMCSASGRIPGNVRLEGDELHYGSEQQALGTSEDNRWTHNWNCTRDRRWSTASGPFRLNWAQAALRDLHECSLILKAREILVETAATGEMRLGRSRLIASVPGECFRQRRLRF